jgi:tetratricopeptide (TPR) repeat protein
MKKLFLVLLVLSTTSLVAQPELTMPESSQKASVTQRIGLTDITVQYHSPKVKGRTIWGEVVPYGQVWRAGANQNTTITVSTEVTIGGKKLPAGTYGLHMIPEQQEWTVIFSKDAEAWGSYFYKEQNDALRVKVKPAAAEMQEWLSYSFEPAESQTTMVLRWEKLRIPVVINVDVPEVVYQSMKKELTGLNGFYWQSYNQAADYLIRNNIHLDEAEDWVNRSIKGHNGFANQSTKALLLEKTGRKDEAAKVRKQALEFATEPELNAYGYELLRSGNKEMALEIFRKNVKQNPASWNVYDSLGDALAETGDKKGAIENFEKALAKAPEDQKQRIKDTIAKLSK